jgi:hypothetical protein
MKNHSNLSRNGKLILFVFISALIVTACTSILPLAKTNFNNAKALKKQGKLVESIEKATAAIVVQKDYDNAKKFVYKNWDKSIPTTLQELKSIENTTDISEADRKVYLYNQLVKVYDNLSKIELPLKHPKGKWSWTTPMKNYKPQLKQSKVYAFNLYFKTASEYVDRADLKGSYSLFNTALDDYTPSEKKKEVKKDITVVYNAFGDKYQLSSIIEEVIKAYRAYNYSLKFISNQVEIVAKRDTVGKRVSNLFLARSKAMSESNIVDTLKAALKTCDKALSWNSRNKEAKELKKTIKLGIYKIYFIQAEEQEKKNTIESLEESIKYYKLAMKWKIGDQVSRERIAANKLKIAELFYQQGLALEKQDAGKDEIIANYKNAQKWAPNYKDTKKRIYIVSIVDEIKKLEVNVNTTYTENERTRKNVSSTAAMLKKANTGLDKVTYVSDKFRSLHGSIKTVVTTCKALTGIPVIGTIASTAKTTIGVARKPIDNIVLVFGRIEKPVITPSKKIVAKSKNLVDSVNIKMVKVSKSLAITQKSIKKIRVCMQDMEVIEDIKQVERDIRNVNKNLVKFNNEFVKINNSLDGIKSVAKSFNSFVSPINKIESGIKSFSGPIKVLGSATHEITKVLKTKIMGYTIEKILHAATGALSYLLDQAMKPLKPYLNKLGEQIPPIPGIDAFTKNVEGLKGEYGKLNKEYNKALSSYNKLTSYEKEIKKSYNNIVAKTGCGQKM